MSDEIEDVDDNKMDIEAHTRRQEQTKQIDALGFDPDLFNAIESEFKEFLNEHLKDKDLDKFRQEYQKINKALKSSYDGEKKLIKKCKELISQTFDKASNYRAAIRMSNNEVEKIEHLKNERQKGTKEIADSEVEEAKQKEIKQKLHFEIQKLKQQQSMPFDLDEAKRLKALQAHFDELQKFKEEQEERLENVKSQNRDLEAERDKIMADMQKQKDDILTNENLIAETKAKALEKAKTSDQLELETKILQEDIQNQKMLVEEKRDELLQIKEDNKNMKADYEQKAANLQDKQNQIRARDAKLIEIQKIADKIKDGIQKETVKDQERTEKLNLLTDEIIQLEVLKDKKSQVKKMAMKKLFEAEQIKMDLEQRKDGLKLDLEHINEVYENKKKTVEEDRKEIEQKKRERDLLNKDVASAEEKGREQSSTISTLENELKKIQNKIQIYQTEIMKHQRTIRQLENDKYKYGAEATKANAKYYNCLEQVKLKNNLITKLQKKNIEAEAKLKQQQNLYEAVRSDRNLYSKNLIEAQDEIADLRMKYRRMTQQISQLKEEISSKDASITSEHEKKNTHQSKNETLKAEIDKIKRNITSSEDMIKTQDEDIARLKYVISEAESEKQKQRKDYEMVINERDILGTQLIKRNEELALLYEKIKIQRSTLGKGEKYYQERLNDILNLRKTIAELKKHLLVSQNETDCTVNLKKEIYLLQKDYLEQQQKAKYLYDELQKPFNVHRWRKLECTDPEQYEMIQKIQSLQKRLIAKSEEVSEKDVLIQEKEKLYIELKNILAKQSGPEVEEKLEVYQKNLKERTNQLKEMVKELKNYQSQVNAYKFEIERIDNKINEVKQLYFNSKQKQQDNQYQPINSI